MASDKHMEAARQMLHCMNMPASADDLLIAATTLAAAEREGMKRAAEIIRTRPMRFAGMTEGYIRGALNDAILSEAGEGK